MVYPVNDINFKIGINGLASSDDDMVMISDMESFSLTFDNGIEEWSPLESSGWTKRMMTTKSVRVTLSGKRNYGSAGNDYAASLAYKTGSDASTVLQIEFPNGDTLEMKCIVNVTAAGGGESSGVAALELELLSDGKPTYTAA